MSLIDPQIGNPSNFTGAAGGLGNFVQNAPNGQQSLAPTPSGLTPEQFCYWLQGWLELQDEEEGASILLSPAQLKLIRQHLGSVFTRIGTPAQWPYSSGIQVC